MIDEIISVIVVVSILIVPVLYFRNREKKDYNNGYCPKCGEFYRWFDSDSQGGRGYCCDRCGHHCWVSYNVDKDRENHLFQRPKN